ncbi:peptidylprolyl isomerase [Patescibacteria group bacterium]|nr:peptidylprolyl isomerase [Patescibacteria group bacterium]MBU1673883.1 peptidylprolyl isomerase [Patescibacteria group bacterium]MBU1963260.1 peptidylprolyl isomerase [Patescibacteria group bacterium]
MEEKTQEQSKTLSDSPQAKRTEGPKEAPKKGGNGLIIGLIIGLIAVIILIPLLVFGIGIYALDWDDKYTNQVADIVPYPAAIAGSNIVSYSEWKSNVDSLLHFYEKQAELGMIPPGSEPSDKDIKTDELDRLIKKAILYNQASAAGITVSQEDIDKKFDEEVLPQSQGGIEEIEQTLDELYGWSVDDFKKNVIEEMIYREKLAEVKSEDLDNMSKDQAQAILDKLKAGESFEELAAQYGEDGTAATGGDLGWFEKGVMVPEFDKAIFEDAPVGELYPELVKTQFGYHVILVEEIKEEGETVQAKARHILISNNLDKYLENELESMKIYRFVAK